MHHVRSASLVLYFRIAAFLLFVICLLAPVAAGLLIQSMLNHDFRLTIAGSGLAIFSLLLIIPQWTLGAHTNCPLCWTPVLAPKGCTKHLNARTLMGSHRLRVALAVLLRNQFRCPYCNESTAMETGDSSRHASDHQSQPD
jgi:hypothetical protein